MIAIRSGRHSKPIPRRDAVILQAPRGATLLKRLKCRSQALVKLFFRNLDQLRLRIVDVINVHTTDTHVSERLLQLILQIGWSHAVTAADDILLTRYAGLVGYRRRQSLHDSSLFAESVGAVAQKHEYRWCGRLLHPQSGGAAGPGFGRRVLRALAHGI